MVAFTTHQIWANLIDMTSWGAYGSLSRFKQTAVFNCGNKDPDNRKGCPSGQPFISLFFN
jgi:hypothetical protein